MSQFVESLCRLYKAERVNLCKLEELLSSRKITEEEFEYIISN